MSVMERQQKPIYSVLAHIYDTLMQDVDYEAWADYIDDLIQLHAPESEDLLELACGTGSVALSLAELGYYRITGTDLSATMVDKAVEKSEGLDLPVRFLRRDFLDIDLDETFDVVYLVFDSINYLHAERDILKLHDQVVSVLRPGGLFIFDFTTPAHSRQVAGHLDKEEGTSPDHYHFFRTSRYDEQSRIHTNAFNIERLSPDHTRVLETFSEVHRQKIYTFSDMKRMIRKTGFRIVKAYDEFQFDPATDNSPRITIVSEWQPIA